MRNTQKRSWLKHKSKRKIDMKNRWNQFISWNILSLALLKVQKNQEKNQKCRKRERKKRKSDPIAITFVKVGRKAQGRHRRKKRSLRVVQSTNHKEQNQSRKWGSSQSKNKKKADYIGFDILHTTIISLSFNLKYEFSLKKTSSYLFSSSHIWTHFLSVYIFKYKTYKTFTSRLLLC